MAIIASSWVGYCYQRAGRTHVLKLKDVGDQEKIETSNNPVEDLLIEEIDRNQKELRNFLIATGTSEGTILKQYYGV